MANIQNYSNQMKKFSSKITVLVCVTTFERYGHFISEFSAFSRIKNTTGK